MAAGLLLNYLPDIQSASAGLSALVGMPADDTAVRVMARNGIDISAHRAQQINRALCVSAGLILVMDRDQRRRLLDLYPEVRPKTYRLGEHLQLDIPDPYRMGEESFERTYGLLETTLAPWIDRIQQLR